LGKSNRLNFPDWLIKAKDSYGALRMQSRDLSIRFDGIETTAKIVAAYHPSYGRDDAKLSEIKKDAEFVASLLIAS
jgi:hypothetical protein